MCTCSGTVHDACSPEWPKNLSDDQLLRTYENTLDHPVTGKFTAAVADEMKNRGLSSRRWLPVDEDD